MAPPPSATAQAIVADEKTKIFSESTFFKEKRAPALPTPDQIRAINVTTGDPRATQPNRPPPVKMETLGLLIKYGIDVGPTEAQTQVMVRERLLGRVPVPEVYGWTEDGGQRFIYMELIKGDTLEERWRGMDEEERATICRELRVMVSAWRQLKQEDWSQERPYIGSLGKQPLNDIFFRSLTWRVGRIGPFEGPDAVRRLQDTCHIEMDETDETDRGVIFTHNDFTPPNIVVSRGPNPNVVAMIDWCQSGWYPVYWEYCKARMVSPRMPFFDQDEGNEWYFKYLPMIMEVEEDSVFHPFLYFFLSWGI